jgi:pilus assembly protein CpaB
MNRRALVIAAIVGLLGAALLAVYLRRFEREASGGEPVKLLTALKPIESGVLLTEDMLATRLVPRAYVEDRAVLERDRAKVVGLRMGQSLQAQQTLMWTDLQIAMEERRNLSSLIQPGMRAVTIAAKSSRDKSYALIRPGDRIDVIATLASPTNKNESNAVVLLQNVLVLAVGVDTGAEVEKTANQEDDLLLSLSITVPEAQLLALSTEQGKLSVALRNPHDVRITEGLSEISSSTLTDAASRSQVRGLRTTSDTGPEKID